AEHIHAVAIRPDGAMIAATSNADLILWDASTGKVIHRLMGPGYGGWSLDFSPDGKTLASTSDWPIRLWGVARGKMAEEHRPLKRPGTIRFSPDGKHLALCGDDGALMVWSVAEKKVVKQMQGHERRVSGVAWSPDGARLFSTAEDCTIRLWDWTKQIE